jgi:hypothetical protein
MSESDDRFDICRSVGSCSARAELGTPRTPSRSDTAPVFRGLLLCFATALITLPTARTRRRVKSALTAPCRPADAQQQTVCRFPFPASSFIHSGRIALSHAERGADRAPGGQSGFQTGTFVPIREKARKPEFSGKIAAIFPAVLVANRSSAAGFEPVRSRHRFRSGPGGSPTASLPALDARREMKPGGA